MDVLSKTNYSEWPEFILVSAFSILKCNGTETKVIRELDPTAFKTYYGMTWDHLDTIYYTEHSGEGMFTDRDKITLMDDQYDDIKILYGAYPNSHQIHYDNGQLAVTCAASSQLCIVDVDTEEGAASFHWDTEHVNAVFSDGATWWVNMNNIPRRNESEILQIDAAGETLKSLLLGTQVHNIARIGDLLYVCSSGDGRLIVYNLVTDEIDAEISGLNWVRGLTVTEKNIIIGSSVTETSRVKRFGGGCQVHLLDRETLEMLDTLMFTDIGPIHEIRGTVGDLAHNGIDFPGV